MIITVFFLNEAPLKTRIRQCLIIAGIGICPLALWLLRNRIVADSAANRSLAFHPLKQAEFNEIANAIVAFWLPFSGSAYLKIAFLFLGACLVLTGVALAVKSRRSEHSEKIIAEVEMFAAVFITTYLLFLCAYNSFMDPAVDLSTRVLSPIYAPAIILIICFAFKLSRLGTRVPLWRGFLFLSLALIAMNARHAVSFAAARHNDGSGFASRAWAGSKTIKYLRNSSDVRTTYSNGIDAVYFQTKKKALRIPAKIDPTNGKSNLDFEREINSMRSELLQNRAVLVYLDKITWRWYLPTKDELNNVYKLPVLLQLDDGTIYGIE